MLRTKASVEPVVIPGYLFQVVVKNTQEKIGKCLSPRTFLEFYQSAGTVSIAGSIGHTIFAAIEDTRSAIVEDDFSASLIEAIDSLEAAIDDSIADLSDQDDDEKPSSTVYSEDYILTGDDISPMIPNPRDRLEVYWTLDNQ